MNVKKISKEEESIEILKSISLISNMKGIRKYKIMNQEFRLKKIIDVIRNYLIEEINQNELTSKKHKKICRVLNYIEHSLIIISTTSGCVSIPAFASLNAILIGITSSAMGVTISVITAEIKKYNSVKKKKGRGMIK